ncbi:cupin [Clostridium sp. MF28]|uniref:cupin domain-containing protein n=1 Tax=Clostridium TaxID=1485 RepID=UPI000CFA066F|nr:MULTISPECIES: cupin domain-containing protein [Clostridium]AVK51209.1 cupin [Clostridium sp. MF28]PSM55080.1 cupin [Clostridium diolis]
MKELTIKNLNAIEAIQRKQNDNEFYIKPVVAGSDANQCTVSFIEVPPGNQAFGYHYHEKNEEVFYIISGVGSVRTPDGIKSVKAGDIITFPAGKEGAHVISNASDTENLVYVDFDTHNVPEVVSLPDSNQVMVLGNHIKGTFNVEK